MLENEMKLTDTGCCKEEREKIRETYRLFVPWNSAVLTIDESVQ